MIAICIRFTDWTRSSYGPFKPDIDLWFDRWMQYDSAEEVLPAILRDASFDHAFFLIVSNALLLIVVPGSQVSR